MLEYDYAKFAKVDSSMTKRPPITSTPPWRNIEFFDPDALSEAVTSSCLEHHQLGSGAFRGNLYARELDGCQLNSGFHNRALLARGNMPRQAIIVGTVLEACQDGRISGLRFGRRDLVCFPAGAELDYIMPAHTHWVTLQMPVDWITHLLDDETQQALFETTHVLPASRPGVAGVVRLLGRSMVARPETPILSFHGWESLLAERLQRLASEEIAGAECRRCSSRADQTALLRRFDATVKDRLSDPLRISALCQNLDVSQRTLEQVFKDRLDLTPQRYLRLLRLHAARRVLMSCAGARDGVAVAAASVGFPQPGRFSAYYCEHFGEQPSETLLGASRRWGYVAKDRI